MTNLPVPASEAEVTEEWLQAILADPFPQATFASVSSERIGEAYGFASRIFRVQWQDGETLRSVVVKLWKTDSKTAINELLFYRTFQDVGARIPACYYSGVNENAKTAVLVLEDFRDAVQGDVLESLDLESAEVVARSLAKLHATWLKHPLLSGFSWLSDGFAWSREVGWVHSRRVLFLGRFPNRLHGLPRLLLDKLELAPQVTTERLAAGAMTLLHGDFHLDNFLFVSQNEPVMLDWSRPVRGPAALNLANLLFEMTFLRHFDPVFDCYLQSFNECAEVSLNKTELLEQLGGAVLRKFELSTCGLVRWRPTLARGGRMIDATIKRAGEMVEFWHRRDPNLFSFLH